jgi:hypothetical protein
MNKFLKLNIHVLLILILQFVLISCHSGNQNAQVSWSKKSDSLINDSIKYPAKPNPAYSYKTETIVFDWNSDGIGDTIFFKGIKKEARYVNWEQTIFKVSGHKPLVIGDEPNGDVLFVENFEFNDHPFIKKIDLFHSKLALRIPTNQSHKDDIIVLRGWGFASDPPDLYIINLDHSGDPKLIYKDGLPNVDFMYTDDSKKEIAMITYPEFIDLEGYNYDSSVNGQIPNGVSSMKNKKGNVLQCYSPNLVYRFGKGTMEIDTTLSKKYNDVWAGYKNPEEYVIFYKKENAKPQLFKRKDFMQVWNNIK